MFNIWKSKTDSKIINQENSYLQYGNHYLPVALSSVQNDGQIIYTCIASNEAGNAEQHYRINRLGTTKLDLTTVFFIRRVSCCL
jgi:hypothetical protein